MARHHLVRVGAMGHVGRFTAVDAVRYPRRSRVIVRTVRGLEIGEVLVPAEGEMSEGLSDGSILRAVTVEDELLQARLEKNRNDAFAACNQLLAERKLAASLVDVEQLFDGQSIYFYFLGTVSPEVELLTSELADIYETKVQLRKFTDALVEGCGPGCGTESAVGGGCSSCSTGCSIASACATKALNKA